jgi:hypothetical protein
MTKAASLNPETFIEGSGLIDDVDVTLISNKFALFDYNGTVTPGSPSLLVKMQDDEGNEYDQYYSMGSAKDWMPSEDGSQLLAVGSATSIRISSNGGILLKSLVDAGFPVDKLGDDITILDGTVVHVIRVPAPQRPGVKMTDKQKEREEKYGPATILVVSEIRTLPWDKKTPKGAPKAAAKPVGKPTTKPVAAKTTVKAAPAPEPEEEVSELSEKAINAVMEILANGPAAKKELPAKLFQTMKEDPDRNAIVKMVFDDEFLGSGPWSYEGGVLSLG